MNGTKWLVSWMGVWFALSIASDMTSDSAGSRQFVNGLALSIALGSTYLLGPKAFANITGQSNG